MVVMEGGGRVGKEAGVLCLGFGRGRMAGENDAGKTSSVGWWSRGTINNSECKLWPCTKGNE